MMNNNFSPFDSTVIINKPGVTARYVITQVGADRLIIEHQPNLFPLAGFIISLILTAVLAWFRSDYGIFSGLFLLIFISELAVRRPIHCEFVKSSGEIHYTRGGLFGLPFGRQQLTWKISDIGHLEMARHIRRGGDTFQVVLWRTGFKKINLSHDDLGFAECQRVAEKIRDFADKRILISAVD